MFIEKEVKILNIEYAVLVYHLEKIGAKKTGSHIIRDRYYDNHNYILRNKKQRLRLRSQGDTTTITQKTKINDSYTKSMTEQDITVENIEKGHKLLQELELHCIKYKEKKRISYQIDDIHFDIDCYDNIPILLEIEGPTNEKIKYRINRLGLQYHTKVKRGSRKLFKHYNIQ